MGRLWNLLSSSRTRIIVEDVGLIMICLTPAVQTAAFGCSNSRGGSQRGMGCLPMYVLLRLAAAERRQPVL